MPDTMPAGHQDAPDPSDREETVRYIGHAAGELRDLALRAELPFLAYLLGMVEDEALNENS